MSTQFDTKIPRIRCHGVFFDTVDDKIINAILACPPDEPWRCDIEGVRHRAVSCVPLTLRLAVTNHQVWRVILIRDLPMPTQVEINVASVLYEALRQGSTFTHPKKVETVSDLSSVSMDGTFDLLAAARDILKAVKREMLA